METQQSSASDVDKLFSHCRYYVKPISTETQLWQGRVMLRRSLNFCILILPLYATSPMNEIRWPSVRADDVLFHVALLLNALSLERLEQQEEGWDSKKVLEECMARLRNRLPDPELGISDHTTVAVANLATIEVCQKFWQCMHLCYLIVLSMDEEILEIINFAHARAEADGQHGEAA